MKQPEGSGHQQSKGAYTMCVKVAGMTCPACERAIRRALMKISGVRRVEVSFATGDVRLASSRKVTRGEVRQALEGTGYNLAGDRERHSTSYIAPAVVVAVYFILRGVGLTSRLSFFPQASDTTTLAALLVVGFLTSFHCVAMCGGLNLGQSNIAAKAGHSPLLTNLAYQVGRLASYTSIGAVVGLVGSVIALKPSVQAVIMIAAGALMAMCALNLFGVGAALRHLAPRLPSPVTRLLEGGLAGKGSFALGVLNGLMPCGPLQAMQLYALGTGSALRGAASMFAFCSGTVPLLFAVGFLAARMSRRFSHVMMRAQAAAILLMALCTAGRGLALAGVTLPVGRAGASQVSATSGTVRKESTPRGPDSTAGSSDDSDRQSVRQSDVATSAGKAASADDTAGARGSQGAQYDGGASDTQITQHTGDVAKGTSNSAASGAQGVQQAGGSPDGAARSVQRVASTASFRSFEPITVVRGVPVEWTLSVPKGELTGCNAALVIPEYRLTVRLAEGDNLITFTPQRSGTFVFSCWMGMITSFITVVDA